MTPVEGKTENVSVGDKSATDLKIESMVEAKAEDKTTKVVTDIRTDKGADMEESVAKTQIVDKTDSADGE